MIPVLVKLSIVAQFNKQRERERERDLGNFRNIDRELLSRS